MTLNKAIEIPVHPGVPGSPSGGYGPLAIVALAVIAMVVPFAHAIGYLFNVWEVTPEYSHGILIPPIALMLIWRERAWLVAEPFRGSWWGLVPLSLGFALLAIGELSAIQVIVQYGFVFAVYGLVLSLAGWRTMRRLWMPLLLLLFMIPPPAFILNNLSLQMQLISSAIGVALIRAAGISVFLQGNVIDLGTFKLQVAEACDGLRYMFPLMTLGFVLAYFYRAPVWKKALLLVSSVPIAVLMNSLRVGVIGITVEYWGQSMAEGLLHEFQGWLVFMMSGALMIGVVWLLNRLDEGRPRLLDSLAVDFGENPARGSAAPHPVGPSFKVATALAIVVAGASLMLPERSDVIPERTSFAQLPMQFGAWSGRSEPMESTFVDALKLDDYVIANFARPGRGDSPVNLYVAWYDSQRQGRSVHSPKSCLPGGGWTIVDFRRHELPGLGRDGAPIAVNRALVQLGDQRQLVYYFFAQRGRNLTNEYMVKWYIFWDALTRSRTDGSLVRFTMMLRPGSSESEGDATLTQFAGSVLPALAPHVPD
jgi:exosortase D (VPLPA-CTERM-specific)